MILLAPGIVFKILYFWTFCLWWTVLVLFGCRTITYEKTQTLFKVGKPPFKPVIRNMSLANQFQTPITLYDVKLSNRAMEYFTVCMYACTYVCVCTCVIVCWCMCPCVRMSSANQFQIPISLYDMKPTAKTMDHYVVCIYLSVCVCMYVCVCVCVYMCVYVCVHGCTAPVCISILCTCVYICMIYIFNVMWCIVCICGGVLVFEVLI